MSTEGNRGEDLLAKIYQNKFEILNRSLNHFYFLGLKPRIGIEWEFYLLKNNSRISSQDPIIEQFIDNLNNELGLAGLGIQKIEKEQGDGQIEIKTIPSLDITRLCEDFLSIKRIVNKDAKLLLLEAIFDAQYFLDDCGSSLQINFSLVDENNHFLFNKNPNQNNDLLLHSIAGILEMADSMTIFSAPNKNDYRRYQLETNHKLHKNRKYPAPTKISWGYDNRSALVRIPASKKIEEHRLEFRLPASNADIHLVIATMLIAINRGITNKIIPLEPIYGNAFDEKYDLKKIANNYEVAIKNFLTNDFILQELLKDSLSGNGNSPFRS